jgi:hypothetical protein
VLFEPPFSTHSIVQFAPAVGTLRQAPKNPMANRYSIRFTLEQERLIGIVGSAGDEFTVRNSRWDTVFRE